MMRDAMSAPPKLSDDELYARVTELWPHVSDMLRKSIEAIQEELDKSIIDTDEAFALINLLMLREVFMRKTILIAVDRDNTEDIPAWIEQIYRDWDEEAEINEEHRND